jgi:arylsulfatase
MKNPEKLRALQDLWWAEAARNNILPLDWRGPERMSVELTGKPSLAAGRKIFVYETPLAALPEASSPDLKNKSFTIAAEADIPAGGADGMIFTQGGFTGGWGFYIQQGKLVGLHSHVALERYRVVSTEPVPTGNVTLTMDFKYDGGGVGKGGTMALLANGKKIGEGRVDKTTPFKYSLYPNANCQNKGPGNPDTDPNFHRNQGAQGWLSGETVGMAPKRARAYRSSSSAARTR